MPFNQGNLLLPLTACGRFAEAEPIALLFEGGDGVPEASAMTRVYGLLNAAELRLTQGDPAAADADLELVRPALDALGVPTLSTWAGSVRAAVLRAQGDPAGAGRLLATILETALDDVDPIELGRAQWLRAVLLREDGRWAEASAQLDRAWAAVVGREVHCLDLVLQCLLERALHSTDFRSRRGGPARRPRDGPARHLRLSRRRHL